MRYAGAGGCVIGAGVEELGRLQRFALGQVLLHQRLTDQGTRLDELHVGDVVVDRLALFARRDEPALLEDAQVLRDVVHRDADLGGKVADALLAVADGVKDRLTMLVGERLAELGVHAVDGLEVG